MDPECPVTGARPFRRLPAPMMRREIVVVGAGQAGVQAAFSLRQRGFDGRIRLVGAERGLPYQRPPLSKTFLTEGQSRADLLLRTAAAFEKSAIELVDGETVTEIDRAARTVTLESGGQLRYDHLVLALGARNRTLPVAGGDAALDLRTIDDAEAIRDRLAGGPRVAVIGGGFVGLEIAASARKLGCDVVVLEAMDRLMRRTCSSALAQHVLDAHRGDGIDVRLDTMAAGLHARNGVVTRVETRRGELVDADLVIIGIGIAPNVALAEAAGLEVDDGVVVDAALRTGDAHVTAIGDCASFDYAYLGRRTRLESVQNAVDQGKAVARTALGEAQPYAAVPWFWSDQGDLKIQIAGLTDGSTEHVVRTEPGAGSLSVFCWQGDRFVGVETVNAAGDHILARRALDAGLHPSPAEVAAPGFSFKAWMKAARARG